MRTVSKTMFGEKKMRHWVERRIMRFSECINATNRVDPKWTLFD